MWTSDCHTHLLKAHNCIMHLYAAALQLAFSGTNGPKSVHLHKLSFVKARSAKVSTQEPKHYTTFVIN